MPAEELRIATRKSPLALWQAEHVAARLREAHPALFVRLVPMTTQGDVLLDSPLAQIGGKGLFIKELERALLEGRADLAVHSMKDVPAHLPAGLGIAAVTAREDPHDALVCARYDSLEALPAGSRIGTCSLRRQAQLLARYPQLVIEPLRGNVNTRLAKLDAGRYEAIILAAAGLTRLGFGARIRARLPFEVCLPAVGQGIMGIECRADDSRMRALLGCLADPASSVALAAERAFGRRLEASCQVPLAGHAELTASGRLRLRGRVVDPAGAPLVEGADEDEPAAAEALGERLAEALLARGAGRILEALRAANG